MTAQLVLYELRPVSTESRCSILRKHKLYRRRSSGSGSVRGHLASRSTPESRVFTVQDLQSMASESKVCERLLGEGVKSLCSSPSSPTTACGERSTSVGAGGCVQP